MKKTKTPVDSTGLERRHELVDGSVLSPTLKGTQISVVPEWVQKLSRAPGTLVHASLASDLLKHAGIPPETFQPAQQFVRDFGDNIIHEWGQNLILFGPSDPFARRLLAAGTMNEIIRIYHYRTEITAHWLQPRVFENMNTSYDRDKMNTLFSTYSKSKLVVLDSVNVAMRSYKISVEELVTVRMDYGLPTILLMPESPLFSPDVATSLSNKQHRRCIFTSTND